MVPHAYPGPSGPRGRVTDRSIAELIRRPRSLFVLLALGQEGSMNMRRFTEVSGHARQHAQALREELQEMGFLRVEHLSGHGNAGVLRITLTPLGERIAALLLQMDDEVRNGRRE